MANLSNTLQLIQQARLKKALTQSPEESKLQVKGKGNKKNFKLNVDYALPRKFNVGIGLGGLYAHPGLTSVHASMPLTDNTRVSVEGTPKEYIGGQLTYRF